MKKILVLTVVVLLLLMVPVTALAGGTALDRAVQAGWLCIDVAGAMHCFDPGDGQSNNGSSVNLRVFDYDGSFLGTEQLWSVNVYAGQPCPQDELIDLGAFMACHHYAR